MSIFQKIIAFIRSILDIWFPSETKVEKDTEEAETEHEEVLLKKKGEKEKLESKSDKEFFKDTEW